MTPTTDSRIRQATLREEWSVSSVQRLAWAMGHPAVAPAAAPRAAAGLPTKPTAAWVAPTVSAEIHDPARRMRLVQSLARLVADPRATAAERSLAIQRLAALRPADYATAC